MAYNSKYTGEEVEQLLDKASSSDASNFAVCDSSGSAMIKKVTIEGFQLLPGVQVRIKFLNSATTSPMILNVNDTGSFACYYKGNAMHMGWCPFIADKIYTFTYDGETSWILEGDWDSVNKQDTLVSGTTIKTINGTSILGEGDISIPDEVELITISGDMLADEPVYTIAEAQAIIDAYNANKLIAIKCGGTRINFGKGWFIPNINIRTQSGMSQIFLSGILGNYYIEHRILYDTSAGTISATAQSFKDLSESGGVGAEPMVCAYRITSYTANHIELDNYTYNGQTMDYREGAIISITNPFNKDVVFEGGTLTLDGNEYEAVAFTLKVGATILFSLGVDPSVLYEISSVGGATTANNKLPLEDTVITLERNVLSGNVYVIPNAIPSLSVDIAEPTDGVLVKEYMVHFFTGDSVSSFSFPDELLWANGNVPTIEESTAYELSVVATLIWGGYVYKGVLTVFK